MKKKFAKEERKNYNPIHLVSLTALMDPFPDRPNGATSGSL